MNPSTLIALIWMPCVSALHQSALGNETVAMACPGTVKFVYDAPAPLPEQAAPKPVIAKKAAPPKHRYYHRKRRHPR